MEVVVLGTGAADGWPSPFCECLSCTDQRDRRAVRTPTAALLDGAVLIDAGPTVPSGIARTGRSLRDVRHVLITHAHPDHLDPALLLWLDWNPTPHTLHVWGPAAVIAACRDWIGPRTPVELHAISPGAALDLPTPQGDYRVNVIAASLAATAATNRPCCAATSECASPRTQSSPSLYPVAHVPNFCTQVIPSCWPCPT